MDEAATLFGPVWFWHIQKHTTCHLLEDKSVSESVFFDLEPGHIGGLFKNGGTPKSMECSWDFLDWIFYEK